MAQNEIPKTTDGFGALLQQKERIGNADFCVATDGYFQALGIPLIRGRLFDERDGVNSPHVAVISESLARDRWSNQDPIGHTIEFGTWMATCACSRLWGSWQTFTNMVSMCPRVRPST